MLASKVNARFQKVDLIQSTLSQDGALSGLHSQVSVYEICGIQGHNGSECHLDNLPQELTFEQANVLNNFKLGHIMAPIPTSKI